jgi:hypothetical protein
LTGTFGQIEIDSISFNLADKEDGKHLELDRHTKGILTDTKVQVRLKLSALWVSLMFCYVYGDLFGFFEQKNLSEIVSGQAGFIGTQAGLLAAALSVAIPSLMVFLTLVLKTSASRWANIVLGAVYTVIIIATMPGAWMFYVFLGVIEAVLSVAIVGYAWTWPRQDVPA